MASLFRCLFRWLAGFISKIQLVPFLRGLSFFPSFRSGQDDVKLQEAPLSSHLQSIQKDADAIRNTQHVEDHFQPVLTEEDGPLLIAMVGRITARYYTSKVFIKRENHKDERGLNLYGKPVADPYKAARIRIEAANLQFIAQHTTIPVPRLLAVWQENGLWYLKTTLVCGAIELMNVDVARLPEAVARVEEQLQRDVLPQLRALRRNTIGAADTSLPVVPPHRVWRTRDTRVWSQMRRDTNDYVFCHTDLGRQNILVDPETFEIRGIVDWETSGFFPEDWELPLWRANDGFERSKMTQAVKAAERAAINAFERGAENTEEENATGARADKNIYTSVATSVEASADATAAH